MRKRASPLTVTINPDICGGEPCFSGTRLPVDTIIHFIKADGIDGVLRNYPITRDHCELALWYDATFRTRITRRKARAFWLWDSYFADMLAGQEAAE